MKLDLHRKLEPRQARFDALIGVPPGDEPYRFTVLVEEL
jgi:hypothetical protein